MLNLEPLWLRRAKPNLILFNSLNNGNSCTSAPQFTNQALFSFRNSGLVVTTDSRNKHPSKNFIVKYFSFWSLLP